MKKEEQVAWRSGRRSHADGVGEGIPAFQILRCTGEGRAHAGSAKTRKYKTAVNQERGGPSASAEGQRPPLYREVAD